MAGRSNSVLLKAGGLKVRCASQRRYAVTIAPGIPAQRLLVVFRSDSKKAIELRLAKLGRDGWTNAQIFDLKDGALIWAGAIENRTRAASVLALWT